MKLVRRLLIDTKISSKLILFVILVGSAPMLILAFLFNSYVEHLISEETNASYERVVDQYCQGLSYKIETYRSLLAGIASNGVISRMISPHYDASLDAFERGAALSNELGSIIGSRYIAEMKNLTVYSFEPRTFLIGQRLSSMTAAEREGWSRSMGSSGLREESFTYTTSGAAERFASFIKPLPDLYAPRYGEKAAFAKLDVDAESFFDSGQSRSREGKMGLVVFDAAGGVVYENDFPWNDYIPGLDAIARDEVGRFEVRAPSKLPPASVFTRSIAEYRWTLCFIFRSGAVAGKAATIREVLFVFVLVSTILLIALSLLFSHFLSRRIGFLTRKMEKVQNGDFTVSDVMMGKDEISVIDGYFNRMVSRLNSLIVENYAQALERKQAEYNALRLQINPHFLFNTLESINSLAAIANSPEIAEISQKLGAMFRYSLGKEGGDFVTLEEELEHLRNYVAIQKVRFAEKLEISYSIPESVLKTKILKFVLQPMVENAIVHGVEPKAGPGTVEVRVDIEGADLVVVVEDDGVGMDRDQVAYCRRHMELDTPFSNPGSSIGLRNVNLRIKYACGDQYGVEIRSAEGQGTQVTLRLPANPTLRGGADV